MAVKNGKTRRKIDLLDMSDAERTRVIEQIKQNFQRSISEARLWKTLLQYDELTINGQVIFSNDIPLEGFSMRFDMGKV
ncbi:MAG: hypothetical protein QXJ07_01755 [Candidatus Bathyarchaeia archaeon]